MTEENSNSKSGEPPWTRRTRENKDYDTLLLGRKAKFLFKFD